jgi:cyclophilin family peptidyl-prolyl cis-trans isomerase
MKTLLLFCCLAMAADSSALFAQNPSNPVVRFKTDLGDIDVVLLQDTAPKTVANFLRYVNRGAYDNTFIHRSPPNFVIQGGGYKYVNNQVQTVAADPPVMNEFKVSNTRGTLAMAKLGGDPNSATSQWFFNESDSNAGPPSNLDSQNGGFTVFGRITGGSGLSVMDAIAAVPIYNAGSPFDQLPLRNYTSGPIQDSNLVHVISVKVISKFLTLTYPAANLVHLQGFGAANTAYRIDVASTLPGSFIPLVTLTSDASGNISYDDMNPDAKKFYRLVTP